MIQPNKDLINSVLQNIKLLQQFQEQLLSLNSPFNNHRCPAGHRLAIQKQITWTGRFYRGVLQNIQAHPITLHG